MSATATKRATPKWPTITHTIRATCYWCRRESPFCVNVHMQRDRIGRRCKIAALRANPACASCRLTFTGEWRIEAGWHGAGKRARGGSADSDNLGGLSWEQWCEKNPPLSDVEIGEPWPEPEHDGADE